MTTAAPRLPTWLLIAALCVAAALATGACDHDAGSSEPGARQSDPRVAVQAEWLAARDSPGHRAHVTAKQIECAACHSLQNSPSDTQTAFDKPRPDRCVSCHAEQGKIRHALAEARATHGPGSVSDCMSCHQFAASKAALTKALPADQVHAQRPLATPSDAGGPPRAEAWQHCTSCHGIGSHEPLALTTHRFADCSQCHTPHGPTPARPGACESCHAGIERNHGDPGLPVSACTTCHAQMHAPKSLAKDECAQCHAGTWPAIAATATFEPGHDSCTTCHQAHRFDAKDALACTSCHQGVRTVGAAKAGAHAACGSCHAPHAVATASASCATCHQELENDHPTAPGASECGTCHRMHAGASDVHASSAALPCAQCHEGSLHDGVSHAPGLACTRCHRPHQFARSKTGDGTCEACHAQQHDLVLFTPGHDQCVSCHASNVHHVGMPARSCSECHAGATAAVHPGHAACQSCHEPHSGRSSQPCGTCHQAQEKSAPLGHQTCKQCHSAHSGERLAAASCESCHQVQARALHGDIDGGCGQCHRAHGPNGPAQPPTCASCHQQAALPALHRVPEHAQCGQCHSGHQRRLPDQRGTCLSCHTKQQDHFPDAPDCSSCHLFVGL